MKTRESEVHVSRIDPPVITTSAPLGEVSGRVRSDHSYPARDRSFGAQRDGGDHRLLGEVAGVAWLSPTK